MSRFEGNKAIVTGGANGMGAATVEGLVAEGARVAVLDVNPENGAAIAERLGETVRFFSLPTWPIRTWHVAPFSVNLCPCNHLPAVA